MFYSRVRLFPIVCGLLLGAAGAGCGKPEGATFPPFEDPPIFCNADLIKGASYTLVTNGFTLPKSTGEHTYAEDYDGDSKPENQLKNLLNIALLGGFDVPPVLAAAVQAGQGLFLIELTTPDLAQADCARLTFRRAQAPGPADPPPKFDGTDMLKAADGEKFIFYGRIDNATFQSLRPRDQQPGVDAQLTLTLPLTPGETVALRLHGVGITATLRADAHNQLVGLTDGAIHGAETAAETADVLTSAVARVVTAAINAAPSGDFRNTLLGAFENRRAKASIRKCQVMADCCAFSPATCQILPAEVSESIIAGVLSPDVEVFDADWLWKPVPGSHQPNGFSVGVGFDAVRATSLPQ